MYKVRQATNPKRINQGILSKISDTAFIDNNLLFVVEFFTFMVTYLELNNIRTVAYGPYTKKLLNDTTVFFGR